MLCITLEISCEVVKLVNWMKLVQQPKGILKTE